MASCVSKIAKKDYAYHTRIQEVSSVVLYNNLNFSMDRCKIVFFTSCISYALSSLGADKQYCSLLNLQVWRKPN